MADLYNHSYGKYDVPVHERVRMETYGDDIGQTSWMVAEEWKEFASWLAVGAGESVLDVCSGSGGPAVRLASLTSASVTGLDINPQGIKNGEALASKSGVDVRFVYGDASEPLDLPEASFDGVTCIDSVSHLKNRLGVFREWFRVLKPGGRLVFTNPVVVSGDVTSEEIAARSSIGFFLFTPLGWDEKVLTDVGFELLRSEDRSTSTATVSRRWADARARARSELLELEGEQNFAAMQRFLETVHLLASERRLSRYVYLAQRPLT